jgi:hypothetical protein
MPHWRGRFSDTTRTVTEIAVTVFDDNWSPAMAAAMRERPVPGETVQEDRARSKGGRAKTTEL